MRDEALKALEADRNEKRIGRSLEAQIRLTAPTAFILYWNATAISCAICSSCRMSCLKMLVEQRGYRAKD